MLGVPRKRADPCRMLVLICLNFSELVGVPEVELLIRCADGQHVSVAFHPRDRCHYVVVVLSVEQLLDLARLRVPEVDGLRQAHGEDVARAPIKKVQVVVVDQVRGVEDLLRELWYAAKVLLLFVSFLLRERLDQGDVLVEREARPGLFFSLKESMRWFSRLFSC